MMDQQYRRLRLLASHLQPSDAELHASGLSRPASGVERAETSSSYSRCTASMVSTASFLIKACTLSKEDLTTMHLQNTWGGLLCSCTVEIYRPYAWSGIGGGPVRQVCWRGHGKGRSPVPTLTAAQPDDGQRCKNTSPGACCADG